MRDVTWLALGTVLVAVAPWACGDSSDDPRASSTSGGGSSTNGPGGPGAGTGCTTDCQIQCDAPEGSLSQGSCVSIGGPVGCNPVTNAGCAANQVCDIGPAGFRCYGGTNTAKLCEGCAAPVQCSAGFTCSLGVCAKFCCVDNDCGSTGHCVAIPDLGVGTCMSGGSGPGPTSSAEQSSSPASSSAASTGPGGGQGGATSSSTAASSSSAASSTAASSTAASTGAGGAGGA